MIKTSLFVLFLGAVWVDLCVVQGAASKLAENVGGERHEVCGRLADELLEHLDWLLTIIFKGFSLEFGGGCTDIDADVISLFASCDDGSCSYMYNSTTPLLVGPCAIYFFLAFHAWLFASDHRCEIAFVSL